MQELAMGDPSFFKYLQAPVQQMDRDSSEAGFGADFHLPSALADTARGNHERTGKPNPPTWGKSICPFQEHDVLSMPRADYQLLGEEARGRV